ncbi:MAG: dihydrodipicolinate synthase family protein, partial [Verrucomicrobiota bacterium]|nr:dihydrodipicolinate synthase family protein [Verrucomicrobiota bacterium]
MDSSIFCGGIPAIMTPCNADRTPNVQALVKKAQELIVTGMNAVVYCGSMGDWPLVSDADRQKGVAALAEADVPVIVGTGAVNTKTAVAHAKHAQEVGARGLMVIPRLLSRGTSPAAQRNHFAAILE